MSTPDFIVNDSEYLGTTFMSCDDKQKIMVGVIAAGGGQANDQENGGESALGVEDQNVIEDGGEPRQNP